MSYRKTWAKTFEVNELKLSIGSGYLYNIEPCPEHPPYCVWAHSVYPIVRGGWISLQNPLSIPDTLPGVNKKILALTVEGMVRWGGWASSWSNVKVLVDNAEIMPEKEIINQPDTFRLNTFPIGANVETGLLLDFSLWLRAGCAVGSWVDKHEQKISMSAEYYNDVPPVTASARISVKNKQTNVPIANAYVALMSGSVIDADGYTSQTGEITFSNINEGSYMLRVRANGYYDLEQSVVVTAPSVWYTASLAPIPSQGLPWWTIPAMIGVAGVGFGVVTLNAVRGRHERTPPVYVVR